MISSSPKIGLEVQGSRLSIPTTNTSMDFLLAYFPHRYWKNSGSDLAGIQNP